MAEIRTITIDSWHNFVSHVDELSAGLREPAWFRGQAEDWPLRPHLLRHLRRAGSLTVQKALDIERDATFEFRRAAHLYLPAARMLQLAGAESGAEPLGQRIGCVAWWTIMSHHRAPTRLLDWTLSPYVAAYFASESPLDRPNAPDGVVYVLDFGVLRARMDEDFAPSAGPTRLADALMTSPDSPDDLVPLFHQMPTERMLVQQGCFTVCRRVLGDHGEIITRTVPSALTRLLIPDRAKPDFRRRLREMNLTAHSMFGDLDGLGRHAAEMVAIFVDRVAKGAA